MVTPPLGICFAIACRATEAKRDAVAHACSEHGMSQRRACQVLNVDRSMVRYSSVRPDAADLRKAIRDMAQERRRFGYRRIGVIWSVRAFICTTRSSGGFTERRNCKFASAAGVNGPLVRAGLWFYQVGSVNAGASTLSVTPSPMGAASAFWLSLMTIAVNAWHLWDTSLSGGRVARELDVIIARRGCRPKTIVPDNGTEFTSMAILKWCQETKIDWHYIAPGKPMRKAL